MSRYDDFDEYGYGHRQRARQVTGGIKSQGGKNVGGSSWWAQRWSQVVTNADDEYGFSIDARLKRGKNYAKKGQVLSIEIAKGKATAYVQGSRATPYKVLIRLEPFALEQWKAVIAELCQQPLYVAKLLAGEMPQEIEEVFASQGLSLFPESYYELNCRCGCADWADPCKHVAAVCYLIGEELDRDPFLLFKLRGMDRDKLIKTLSSTIAKASKGTRRSRSQVAAPAEQATEQPLSTDLEQFWGSELVPALLPETSESPDYKAALLKQLGQFPMWRGDQQLVATLEPTYAAAAAAAMDLLTGDILTRDEAGLKKP